MKKTLIASLFLLFGCSAPNGELISDLNKDFPAADTLKGEILWEGNEEIGRCDNFIVYDTLLFIDEMNPDYNLSCYNVNSAELLFRYITKGRASNELIFVSSIDVYNKDYFQLPERKSIKCFRIDDIMKQTPDLEVLNFVKSSKLLIYNEYLLNDSTLVANDMGSTMKYIFQHGKGDEAVTNKIGKFTKDYIDIKEGVTSDSLALSAYMSKFTYNKSKNRLCAASVEGILFDLIDVKSQTIDKTKCYSKSKVEISNYNSTPGITTIRGETLMNLSSDDKYIYALYKLAKNMENIILVFDWELNPVKKYYVSGEYCHDFNTFSTDSKYLYSISKPKAGMRLVKYEL